jgi:hypothetical protein
MRPTRPHRPWRERAAHQATRAGTAILAAVTAGALLLAPATAAPLPNAVSAAQAHVVSATVNGFTVRHSSAGLTTITWDVVGTLPMGGARPEFAVDGVVVGTPTPTPDRRQLVLTSPGLGDVDPAALSTVAAGRRLDAAGAAEAAQAAESATTDGPAQGASGPLGALAASPLASTAALPVLAADPGARGRYRTRSFGYRLPSMAISGLPRRVEVLGHVVAPVGAPGRRPLVLLLPGRHPTCYNDGEVSIDWPCADGFRPIPSERGYDYLQTLLASQGYVPVSVAANGINGQDDVLDDAGAGARSTLVRHHLDVLAGWAAGTGPKSTTGRTLRGVLDLSKIMLVGHSRGGEGVNRATIDVRASDPYRVVGQVLIAPTDFGRQVAAGVPTTVLLPYCDGDVSDLQGQQYVDQGRSIAAGDNSLKTSVLLLGANHNFFNTEWTPGSAAAPAVDDWFDEGDRACGRHAPTRLSAAQQRSAAAAYVAAAAQTYLSASTTAVKLLDGSPVRAASAGRAVALVEAIGGRRQRLFTAAATDVVAWRGATYAARCPGYVVPDARGTLPATPCSTPANEGSLSPHWLPGSSQPAPQALRVRWTGKGGGATFGPSTPRDVSSAQAVDLRVIADPGQPVPALDVVLTDASGRSQTFAPVRQPQALPRPSTGARFWGQTVRVVLPARTTVDRRHLASITLRPRTTSGRVFVLDAYASRTGLARSSVSVLTLPRLDERDARVVAAVSESGTSTVHVSIPVRGAARSTSRVWVATTSVTDGVATGRAYPLTPGQTSLSVPVTVLADGTFSVDPVAYQVQVTALRDAVTGRYVGTLDVDSVVPAPTLTALEPHVEVHQGETIRWTPRLSAPVRGWWSTDLSFTKPSDGVELTSAQVLRSWSDRYLQTPRAATGAPRPLSGSGATWTLDLSDLVTTATVELPLAAGPAVTSDRLVQVQVEPDGVLLTEPLVLTAAVRAATG